MTEKLGSYAQAGDHQRCVAQPRRRRLPFSILWPATGLALISLIACGAVEAKTSFLQSMLFTRVASELTYDIRPGPSAAIAFPRGGPEDNRRGYSDLSNFVAALNGH